MKYKLAALIFAGLSYLPMASAGQYGTALGQCVYNNLSADDKKVMTQWAFVTLGKTPAAKEISAIPRDKTKAVESAAKQTMKEILLNKCSKEFSKTALYEQKQGLQDAVSELAVRLAKEQLDGKVANIFPDTSSKGTLNVLKAGEVLNGFFKAK